jgi:hypothetical protein
MTRSAKTLVHHVSRAPLTVLLIVLGLCAGLAPLTGAGPAVRAAQSSMAFSRPAAAPSPVQASERLAATSKGALAERDSSFGLPPSSPILELVVWIALPLFGGQPIPGLREFAARPYQARAPPAV